MNTEKGLKMSDCIVDDDNWEGCGCGRQRRPRHIDYEGMKPEQLTDIVFDLLIAPPSYRTVLDARYGVRRDF
jgi:hypothetical protein